MTKPPPQERAKRIRVHLSAGVAGVVAAGQELIEWKDSLPRGDFGPMVRNELGWNENKAERLMVVATHEVIANPANFAGLPPSPNTLYELTKLKKALAEALGAGEVHPDMRGSDAAALCQKYRRTTAATKAKTAEPNEPSLALPTSCEVRCADSAKAATWEGVTADLGVFSPPYNWGEDYDEYDDMLSPEAWRALLGEVTEHLVATGVGRICINVPGAIGRKPYLPVVPEVLRAVGWLVELEAEIIWDKATTGNRTSWGSWRSPSAPCLRDRTERILIFRSDNELRIPEGVLAAGDDGKLASPWLSAERFTELTQDLWKFSPARTDGSHPCPFPVELPRRLLQLYGWPGCTVVDPFAGSGTTGVAAVELGASAVLVDVSRSYCEVATQRVAAAAEAVA